MCDNYTPEYKLRKEKHSMFFLFCYAFMYKQITLKPPVKCGGLNTINIFLLCIKKQEINKIL